MERADFVKGFIFQARERRNTQPRELRVVDNSHARYCIAEHVAIGCRESFLWVDLIHNISSEFEFVFPVQSKRVTA